MVKEVVYFPVFYTTSDKQMYRQKTWLRIAPQTPQEDHWNQAWKLYRRLALYQRQTAVSGRMLAVLNKAFNTLNHVRKLTIGGPADPGQLDTSQIYGPEISKETLCPCPDDCELDERSHFAYLLPPESWHHRSMDEVWYPVMVALSVSNARITEINTNSSRGRGLGACLAITAFDSVDHRFKYVLERMEILTKLHLDIGINQFRLQQKICGRGDIAKALSRARNLESLYIHTCQEGPDMTDLEPEFPHHTHTETHFTKFQVILGGCHFPKLRSLILQSIEVSEVEFIPFLHNSPLLESLLLSTISLNQGRWHSVAEKIRELKFKKVVLEWLRGVGPMNEEWDWFYGDQQMTDDFFFGNGENPLVVKPAGQDTKPIVPFNAERWRDRFDVLNQHYHSPVS